VPANVPLSQVTWQSFLMNLENLHTATGTGFHGILHHLITVTTFTLAIYHSLGLSLQIWNLSLSHILSSIVFLVHCGLPYQTKWSLAFVCFSLFFIHLCLWLRVLDSAFESTLNSSIVSYRYHWLMTLCCWAETVLLLATGVMAARGLLANPAMFTGAECTTLECLKDWVRYLSLPLLCNK